MSKNYESKNRMSVLRLRHWKVIAAGLMIYDAFAIAVSYFIGLWLRFDFRYTDIPTEYLHSYTRFIPAYIIVSIVFFWYMRMYRGIWRFAGFNELIRYASSSLIASAVHSILITLLIRRMPFSYYIVGGVLQLILVVGMRFSYRFYTQVIINKDSNAEEEPAKKVMIIGAGAGVIIGTTTKKPLFTRVCGFA